MAIGRQGEGAVDRPEPKKAKPAEARGLKREAADPVEAVEEAEKGLLAAIMTVSGRKSTVWTMTVTQSSIISPSSPILNGQMWNGSIMQKRPVSFLESDKVWKARDREMAKMAAHSLMHDIALDDNGVRPRLVAQELNLGSLDDSTPPLWVHRLSVASAATKRKADKSLRRLRSQYDGSVAFLYAPSSRGKGVKPPPDVYDCVRAWDLDKCHEWDKRDIQAMASVH